MHLQKLPPSQYCTLSFCLVKQILKKLSAAAALAATAGKVNTPHFKTANVRLPLKTKNNREANQGRFWYIIGYEQIVKSE
jgi:hypothetical protein